MQLFIQHLCFWLFPLSFLKLKYICFNSWASSEFRRRKRTLAILGLFRHKRCSWQSETAVAAFTCGQVHTLGWCSSAQAAEPRPDTGELSQQTCIFSEARSPRSRLGSLGCCGGLCPGLADGRLLSDPHMAFSCVSTSPGLSGSSISSSPLFIRTAARVR